MIKTYLNLKRVFVQDHKAPNQGCIHLIKLTEILLGRFSESSRKRSANICNICGTKKIELES